ncbi:RAD51-associated protein 1-like isoform X2 [Gigantopelta aegis]|uniref:RAD51-associated protein 1-like isoform X2 n=1 Tax=Gigantopelta aegis TaxID=1735272 RepID=UPI001B88859E|nr:RAD51-associated protein 1-like isoform X2 [Gigantopelta aegis]
MSERRSDRSRKQIDYSKFGDGGHDDDDFADSFSAPKKKKTTIKENSKVKKVEKRPAEEKIEKVEKKRERANPKDKIFDNELQIALEVSLSEAQICSQPKDVSQEQDVESKINEHSVSPKKCEEDEISLIEENVTDEPPAKRRRAASSNNKDDQDYTAEEISDDDDDDDDDENFDVSNDENDSDFDCGDTKSTKKKSKVLKKTQPSSKKSKAASTPKAREVAPAQKTKTTPVRTPTSVPRPAKDSPAVGLAAQKQVWNPPNSSDSCKTPLGGMSVKSPTSGIRIGLSRNQRVKPLHPSLKIQP